jgi:cellulose 1,4-beta-cellobiosidase
MTTPGSSVSGLDIGTLTQDAVSRGYTQTSWFLIDVEAGFELWQGGAGLATNSFSVSVSGAAAPSVTGAAAPSTSGAAAPSSTASRPGPCRGTRPGVSLP